MSKHIYGIDFGTSNSVLAALDKTTNKITKVISESSLIYFQNVQQIYIGNQAIQKYIDNNMSGRLLKSLKTLLPQSNFTFTYIYGKKYTAEDLVGLILQYLKKEADIFLQEDVTEVVLGRPVVFSDDIEKDKLAEKRLLTAAHKAGFEKVWFQYEPIAAGYLYEQSLEEPEVVLIGDFGGGTSDFTLMKLDKQKSVLKDRKSDILKTGGIHIGGDDFDAEIMWHKLVAYFGYGIKYDSYGKMLDLPVHIFRTLCEWEQMAFLKEGKIRKQLDNYYQYTNKHPALKRLMDLIDKNLGFSLFRAIEKAKMNLSDNESSEIDFQESDMNIHHILSIDEFNQSISKEAEEIETFLTNFINDSEVEFNDIQNVFLTGGTSSTRSVMEIFERKFDTHRIHRGDNFNSVAQGLALSYAHL